MDKNMPDQIDYKQLYEDLKRRENDLRRQNDLFLALMKNLQMGVFMVEAPSGKPLLANDAAYRLMGRGILPDVSKRNLSEVYKAHKFGSHEPYPPEEMPVLRGMNGEISSVDDMIVERPDGTTTHLEVFGSPVRDDEGKIWASIATFSDITERKLAEEALRESEATVRRKLEAITEPDGDIGNLNLADIIDVDALQSMMEDFYRLTGVLNAVLDVSGKILVVAGWQDICTKFHRVNPCTARNCLESDVQLASGVPAGTFKVYKCKNNLWDMVTPIYVGGKHLGNIYIGQFFYDDEVPDYELFRSQARQYGFDEVDYMAALDRVPRLTRETVNSVMSFFSKLAAMISSLSYSSVKLSRSLSQKDQALRQLAESESQFRAMVETIPLAIQLSVGIEQTTEYLNPKFVEMFGYTMEDIPSIKEWLPLAYPDEECRLKLSEEWTVRVNQAIKTGTQIEPMEAICTCKDGSKKHISWGYIALGDKNYAYGLDLTERKQAEAERARLEAQLQQALKMEAVGRLAGGVAHDFNNLLTGIIGHVSLALMDVDPVTPLANSLIEVNRAAESAAALTQQLLAFSRKQIIEPRVLDLNEIINSLHNMLTRLIGENIELRTIPAADLGAVKVDQGQFEQILVNLAVNARDAMPEGGRLLIETADIELDNEYCRKHSLVEPGSYVMLAVSDTGCGMSVDVKNHLFEPFYTTKSKGRGTGLGLATIYGTVKQAGGTIDVYSEEGKGTIFKIYLPRVMQNADRLFVEKPALEMPVGTETVLLVEDDEFVREIAVLILERLGYNVLQACDGAGALALAREIKDFIHILLTDVVMPGMNGRQLAEQLVCIHPETKILFTSGYTENTIVHHGIIDHGINFIGKPYLPEALARKLRQILDDDVKGSDE
jgi:PAS domain S-box-containing protein